MGSCRSLLLRVLVAWLLSTGGGVPLEYDMRMLKRRCCRGNECDYLPLGATTCPSPYSFDVELAGWDCTAQAPCQKLFRALALMAGGEMRTDECYSALLEANADMRVDTTCRPLAEGFGTKTVSAARANLAVAILLRERDKQRAHRLLTMAVICDAENTAAVHNLLLLGGEVACADLSDHGEPAADKPCEELPGYHSRMLHDKHRNIVYANAIASALQQRPNARVLDIGAGSGLLAFIAASHGAKRVDALEMVLPVAAVASLNAAANRHLTGNAVHVWPVKSKDFSVNADVGELPSSAGAGYHADIVVHEIFDPSLLGEGVLVCVLQIAPHPQRADICHVRSPLRAPPARLPCLCTSCQCCHSPRLTQSRATHTAPTSRCCQRCGTS